MVESDVLNDRMPRVDVVVPCYNYARYLNACVKSVLDQPGVTVRVLIIDDCSSDETEVVGRALAKCHDQVEFVRHARNKGHIATYNEGLLGWAAGDFTLLLSADDLLAPGMLLRAARVMNDFPDVGFCFGDQVVFSGETEPAMPVCDGGASTVVMTGEAFVRSACATAGNPVATPSVVVRDRFQKEVGGYDPDLPHTADLEMWLRLASRGSVARINAVQAYKRHHTSNMVQMFVAGILPDLRQRWGAFERGLSSRDFDAHLLAEVRTILAEQAIWGAHEAFERGESLLLDELLEFAYHLDARSSGSRGWRTLRWKRRIGRRIWPMLIPAVEAVRRWT